MHEMVHILAIVVAQTKELLYMSDTGGFGLFTNSHQLGWVYVDLVMANYTAQIINLALKKCTFLYLCTLLVGEKAGQHGTEVMQMLLEATTIYKDIMEVKKLLTDQAHRKRPASSSFKRLMEHW